MFLLIRFHGSLKFLKTLWTIVDLMSVCGRGGKKALFEKAIFGEREKEREREVYQTRVRVREQLFHYINLLLNFFLYAKLTKFIYGPKYHQEIKQQNWMFVQNLRERACWKQIAEQKNLIDF